MTKVNTREVLTEYLAEVAEAIVNEKGAPMSEETKEAAKTFLAAGFALGTNSVRDMLATNSKSADFETDVSSPYSTAGNYYLEEQQGRHRQLIASVLWKILPWRRIPT